MQNEKGIAPIILIFGVVIAALAGGSFLHGYNMEQDPEIQSIVDNTENSPKFVPDISTSDPLEPAELQMATGTIEQQPAQIAPTTIPLPPVPTSTAPVQSVGTKAYGEVKFLDFNYEGNSRSNCEDKIFKKGTRVVTQDGLEFELIKDENPKCIDSIIEIDDSWDDYDEILGMTDFPSASHVTIKAVESGRKYEIKPKTILVVKGEDENKYMLFAIETFVGGSTGGL